MDDNLRGMRDDELPALATEISATFNVFGDDQPSELPESQEATDRFWAINREIMRRYYEAHPQEGRTAREIMKASLDGMAASLTFSRLNSRGIVRGDYVVVSTPVRLPQQ